jgi:hypothetical protein
MEKSSSTVLGIREEQLKSGQIVLAPNPVSSILNIATTDGRAIEEIILSDSHGRIIYEASDCSSIDISHLQDGIYFAKIKTSDGSHIQKIVKN